MARQLTGPGRVLQAERPASTELMRVAAALPFSGTRRRIVSRTERVVVEDSEPKERVAPAVPYSDETTLGRFLRKFFIAFLMMMTVIAIAGAVDLVLEGQLIGAVILFVFSVVFWVGLRECCVGGGT